MKKIKFQSAKILIKFLSHNDLTRTIDFKFKILMYLNNLMFFKDERLIKFRWIDHTLFDTLISNMVIKLSLAVKSDLD